MKGSPANSYHPALTADTTEADYWLKWRFFLCALWLLSGVIVASLLIWKYEGNRDEIQDTAETLRETPGTLYKDELWRPCIKGIHPAWLLAYRFTAFAVLLPLLVINVLEDGEDIFYYYTQWTFTLVTFYFAIGSVLSVYGCHQYLNKVGGIECDSVRSDAELGTYTINTNRENANLSINMKSSSLNEEQCTREIAGFWDYALQIVYQTNAGAVMLTDLVFWLIIVPYLAMKKYRLNLILICMHSVNAIFLLGETALNSMRFPWFRIAYFLLWTSGYVIFQWIIHGCISIWWPYPFLDLSSSLAPLWYLMVALLHVPCYALFALVLQMKQLLLSRWFPESIWHTA